jgi:MtfA peptidase
MPFDTTYYVLHEDKTTSISVTIPGDKDTLINTTTEDLPRLVQYYPDLLNEVETWQKQSSTQHINSILQVKSEEAFKNFAGTAFLIFLFALVFGGNWLLSWVKNKNNFYIPKALGAIFFTGFILSLFAGEFFISSLLFVLTVVILLSFRNELLFVRKTINLLLSEEPLTKNNAIPEHKKVFMYYGTSLKFSNGEMESMLTKYFPFFRSLDSADKEKFIHRTRKFIYNKTFYLHTKDGFREMPVLVSASAVQLTFGLKDYLLHYFKNIHIYPEEFYRANHLGICFLEGNVSNNTVNLSWKHFLKGYSEIKDGANVGLHEFAHALYYQKCIVENDSEGTPVFISDFKDFSFYGARGFNAEQSQNILYSNYALTNFQEFWAESVELFFERPKELKSKYPDIYKSIQLLLKQDPANAPGLPVC